MAFFYGFQGTITPLKASSKSADNSVSDVNAAIMMGGLLTQYNTALASTRWEHNWVQIVQEFS